MVPPNDEAKYRNRNAGRRDKAVTENLLPRKRGNDLTDDTHGGKNHDVHRRVGVKPEEMLI
jgi:hypothetical protein